MKNGDVDAMNNLGVMYLRGDGVRSDRKAAMDWYAKAAKGGLNGESKYCARGEATNGYCVDKSTGDTYNTAGEQIANPFGHDEEPPYDAPAESTYDAPEIQPPVYDPPAEPVYDPPSEQ